MLTMLIGGLWHGASWNFIIWGGIHGAMLSVERMMGKKSFYGHLPHILKVAITFAFIGTIVAETVAANKGIGNLMLVASSRFEVPLAFAGLLMTSIMGIGMYLVAAVIERRTTAWAMRGADAMVGPQG